MRCNFRLTTPCSFKWNLHEYHHVLTVLQPSRDYRMEQLCFRGPLAVTTVVTASLDSARHVKVVVVVDGCQG